MNINILIMAGGEGTRFQPLSTPERPKQFINIIGDKSLIRQTFERMKAFSKDASFYVATNARYISLVHEELPEIPVENILGEPLKKNTAPCIAFAAERMFEKDSNSIMICASSDHAILNLKAFCDALDKAIEIAKEGRLVSLGIKPTFPASQYGYIQKDESSYNVKKFVEKPTVELAKKYIAEGNFYWNSGIFVWKTSTILNETKNNLPELGNILNEKDIDAFFEKSPSISIDYGVLEKTNLNSIVPCDIGWSDVGTWQSLKELADSGTVNICADVRRVMEEQLRIAK